MDTDVAKLRGDLVSLRQELRVMRGILAVLLVCIPALPASRASSRPPEQRGTTVKAPLRVVDNSGRSLVVIDRRPGASLSELGAEVTEIQLFNSEGRPVGALATDRFGGKVWLSASHGQAKTALSMGGHALDNPVGAASIVGGRLDLAGGNGQTTAALVAGESGGLIALYSVTGRRLFQRGERARSPDRSR